MTTTAKRFPKDFLGIATTLIRIAFFAVALAMVGVYFLPWARLDGVAEPQSGAELATLAVSPTIEYLFAVNLHQTILLIGCPIVAMLFSLIIVANYARGETHLLSTLVVLAVSIVFQIFVSDIVASDGARFLMGNLLSIVFSVVLLIHHLVIKLHTKLYEKRKYPLVFRKLYFLTGSGFYRSSTDARVPQTHRR